jgi:predicted nucleic acid-binding Zn ribbon protein
MKSMKKPRITNKNFEPIGKVVDKVLLQCRPGFNQSLVRIWDLWEDAVGPDVALHARPAAFKGDLLLVHVSNSSWLYHLRFLEKELIDKINASLGGTFIRKVNFKIGPC